MLDYKLEQILAVHRTIIAVWVAAFIISAALLPDLRVGPIVAPHVSPIHLEPLGPALC